MPIARLPSQGGVAENVNTILIRYPGIEVDPTGPVLLAGTAVAIIPNPAPSVGAAEFLFVPCGAFAADRPTNWAGFVSVNAAPGTSPRIITGRGSKVVPIVTGGLPLSAGGDVFLSTVAGQVTQIPVEPGVSPLDLVSLRVGYAISDIEIILTTDAHYHFPGV